MKLFYSINCGQDCEYYTDEHKKEKWKDAKHYDDELTGYKVSNFGGITKNGENVDRYLKYDKNNIAEICVYINGEEILLYKIVASTFLKRPHDGYVKEGIRKHIHHRDNNSFNFNPDNMIFTANHSSEPHLYLENFDKDEWKDKINRICKKET